MEKKKQEDKKTSTNIYTEDRLGKSYFRFFSDWARIVPDTNGAILLCYLMNRAEDIQEYKTKQNPADDIIVSEFYVTMKNITWNTGINNYETCRRTIRKLENTGVIESRVGYIGSTRHTFFKLNMELLHALSCADMENRHLWDMKNSKQKKYYDSCAELKSFFEKYSEPVVKMTDSNTTSVCSKNEGSEENPTKNPTTQILCKEHTICVLGTHKLCALLIDTNNTSKEIAPRDIINNISPATSEDDSSLRSESLPCDLVLGEDEIYDKENVLYSPLAGPNIKDNISGGGAAGAAGESAPAKPSAFSAVNADTPIQQQAEQKLTHLQVAKQNGFGRREVDIFKMWVQAGGTEHSPTSKTFLRSLRSIRGLIEGRFYSKIDEMKKYDLRYTLEDFRRSFAEYSAILTQPDVYPENKDVLKGLTLPHFFYSPQAATHKSWFCYIQENGAKKIEGNKPKCFEQIYPNSDRKYEDTYEKIEEALKLQSEEETFDAADWYDEKFPDAEYGDRELDLDILQRRDEFYGIIESSSVWCDEGKTLLISDMVEMQSVFLGLKEHLPEGYKDISDYRDFFTFVRCIVDGWWRKNEKNSLTRRQIFSYGVICSPSILRELVKKRIVREG